MNQQREESLLAAHNRIAELEAQHDAASVQLKSYEQLFIDAKEALERNKELEAQLAAVPDDMVLVPRKEILFYIGRIAALKSALSGMLPDGIEDWCDECGGDPDRCSGECDVRIGKVILTQKDKP